MKYVLVVLCLVSCVKGEDSFLSAIPTPVLNIPARLQSTDQFNPLKLNVPSEFKLVTTGHDLINRTPVNKQIQTTNAASDRVNNVPARNQPSTTLIGNPLIIPTPVLNVPTRLETGAGNPLATLIPLQIPLLTTSVRNDLINPTPVVFALGTQPVALPWTNEQQDLGSGGVIDRNLIEPSQVSFDDRASTIKGLEEEPNQVPNDSENSDMTQNMPPCKCIYSEDTQTPPLDFAAYDSGNPLTPQSLTPDGPVYNGAVSPAGQLQNDIRPLIINLQLHLHINNIPMLAACAIPLYF